MITYVVYRIANKRIEKRYVDDGEKIAVWLPVFLVMGLTAWIDIAIVAVVAKILISTS